MSTFKSALDFYEDVKFLEAYHLLVKSLPDNKDNQLIYPYLSFTSLFEDNNKRADYYLSYPFLNYLITDPFALEDNFDIEFWSNLHDLMYECEVPISNLSILILSFFGSPEDSRRNLLDKFVPKSKIEEYWHCAFHLCINDGYHRETSGRVEKCLEINGKCPLPYYLRHFLQQPPENTSYFLEKAIEMKSDYWEARKEIASAYFYDDEYESYLEAIRLCDDLIYLNPSQELVTWATAIKGRSFLALEQPREAVMYLNQALQLDQTQTDLYWYRGSAKNRLKDYVGALNDYKNFLKFKDEKDKKLISIICVVIGTLHFNLGQHNEAIKYYTDAIEKNSNLAIAYFRRAAAFKMVNQKFLSESDIKEGNELIVSKKEDRNYYRFISDDEL